jgi:PTH1 family peptidyl-tRNA hydrolase
MIKLIVGLGNPGKEYQGHRHNAGFWFVDSLASVLSSKFNGQSKFLGETSTINFGSKKVHLLKPQTFMNNSGGSIKSLLSYYNIKPEETLVIHDELDLPVGLIKLKLGGGHGGHNGLRDTIKALDTNNFYRLRMGIGHPGTKNDVVDFVLSSPPSSELKLIEQGMIEASGIIEMLVDGDFEAAMKALHSL